MAEIFANGAKNHHKFTLTVSAVSTSREENSSVVSFQFTLSPVVKSYDWRYWGNSISYGLVIGNKQFSGTIPDYDGYSTVILQSGNLTVPHNADGTKVLPFQFSVTDKTGASYTCGDASASGQTELPRIPRTPPALTVSVEDTNPATLALTGDKAKLVRYASHGAFSLAATAYDGAQIVTAGATCGGRTITGNGGVFEKTEGGPFLFFATDSYGNTAKQELSPRMIAYIPLTCDLAPGRPNAEGEMNISVSGNCFQGSFGLQSNTLAVLCRYREAGGEFGEWEPLRVQWTGDTYTATGDISGLDYQKTYVFQAKAEDLLSTAETAEYTAKAVPVFDWGQADFNINGTLRLNGKAVVDHILEQETNGDWCYRKWESGIAEGWYKGSMELKNAQQIGGFHFAYGTVLFPFSFTAEPITVCSVRATNGYDFCGKIRNSQDGFYCYIGSTATLEVGNMVQLNAYVVGQWK
jgi:hypothetical protein